MKPDRSNYELWFIDMLDGRLDKDQEKVLAAFLSDNPDLKEELSGLSSIHFDPPGFTFSEKKRLEKSENNYTESQFDNLCIAHLENDLSPLMEADLNRIISLNDEKRKRFEFIQKLKLKPFSEGFQRKSSVKRLTIGQKIIRISVAGLSIAASVTILILLFFRSPSGLNEETTLSASGFSPDTIIINSYPPISAGRIKLTPVESLSGKQFVKIDPGLKLIDTPASINNEAAKEISIVPLIAREEIPIRIDIKMPQVNLADYASSESFLAGFNPLNIPSPNEEYRSNVDRFVARFIREKLMKDKTRGDKPVESFELAVTGINSLNKLLGWGMTLQKNKDEEGEVKSYNFNSKLLKFNTPVKKQVDTL